MTDPPTGAGLTFEALAAVAVSIHEIHQDKWWCKEMETAIANRALVDLFLRHVMRYRLLRRSEVSALSWNDV